MSSSSLHELAFKGTLDSQTLKGYLDTDPSELNTLLTVPGGLKAPLTPLSLAVAAGRLNVVTLLLKEAASVLDLERGSERYSPLFYAITRTPSISRIPIITTLLDAGANIENCSTDQDDYTPLMFAISATRERELIHLLVDRNTQLNVREERGGKTAEGLAKEVGLEKELLPKDKRLASRGENVYWFLAAMMVTYMYAKTALGGFIKELLAVPQVRHAVQTATEKFNADMALALEEIGQHVEKNSLKLLDTQKQATGSAGAKKPVAKAKTRPKPAAAGSTSGGLGVPSFVEPGTASATPTPALKSFPLPS